LSFLTSSVEFGRQWETYRHTIQRKTHGI